MFGDSYIAQHVDQTAAQEIREHQYRIYISDALYAIAGGPQAMSRRWAECDPGFEPVKKDISEEEMRTDLLSAVNEGRDSA